MLNFQQNISTVRSISATSSLLFSGQSPDEAVSVDKSSVQNPTKELGEDTYIKERDADSDYDEQAWVKKSSEMSLDDVPSVKNTDAAVVNKQGAEVKKGKKSLFKLPAMVLSILAPLALINNHYDAQRQAETVQIIQEMDAQNDLELSELATSVESLQTTVNEMEPEAVDLTVITEDLTAIQDSLAQLNTDFETEVTADNLEDTALQEQLDSIEEQVDSVDERLGDVETTNTTIVDKLNEILILLKR